MGTIVGIGNCQVHGMARCASAALGLAPAYVHPAQFERDPRRLLKVLSRADIVFAQRDPWAEQVREIVDSSDRPELPVLPAPRLYFSGFHPDLATPLKAAGKCPQLPMGTANSAILLAAWRDGIEASDAITLFRGEVYDALDYYGAFRSATAALVAECRLSGLEIEPLISKWMSSGPFFHVPLHPKIHVLHDIALSLLRNAGLLGAEEPAAPVEDPLSNNVIWPVYPEIAERLGFAGDYVFRPKNPTGEVSGELAAMDLGEFVSRTFAGYGMAPPNLSTFPRMSDPGFPSLKSFLPGRSSFHDGWDTDGWFAAEAAEAVKIICDEELLDDGDDGDDAA